MLAGIGVLNALRVRDAQVAKLLEVAWSLALILLEASTLQSTAEEERLEANRQHHLGQRRQPTRHVRKLQVQRCRRQPWKRKYSGVV